PHPKARKLSTVDCRLSTSGFARALLRWYDREQRDLPWRRAPGAYGTLVSEILLQQTALATVIPYFQRFLARLPDFPALLPPPAGSVRCRSSARPTPRAGRGRCRCAPRAPRRRWWRSPASRWSGGGGCCW